MGDPRQARARAGRDRIVEAAERCFLSWGFHGTAMSRIADAAQMSVGQIYRHFVSKDALITAIVERSVNRALGPVEAAVATSNSKLTRLLSQIAPTIATISDPAYVKLMLELAAEASRNQIVAAILQESDRKVRLRLTTLMRTINGQEACSQAINDRIEILCLLFDGLPWRLVRHPALDVDRLSRQLAPIVRQLVQIAPEPGADGVAMSPPAVA